MNPPPTLAEDPPAADAIVAGGPGLDRRTLPGTRRGPIVPRAREAEARRHALGVPRRRLLRGLLAPHEASTVLVAAPAGYGKTVLLAQWAREDPRPFMWLTLEPADRDPARLLSRLCLALHELDPLEDHDLDAARALTAGEGDVEPTLRRLCGLLSAMGASRRAAVLVLDDAHHLKGSAAPAVVSALAGALAPAGRLALASRTRPPVPLGRLRVQRGVLEIGPGDLAMTAQETEAALAGEGVDPQVADVRRLLQMTRGWPAGVRLAALSLRKQGTQALTGAQEAVRRYVIEEILEPMPAASRRFLLRTSVLDELCPELCDAVLQRRDSASRLRALLAAGTIVEQVDPDRLRLRCLPLVGEALRAELELRHPAEVPVLRRRAGRWLAAHGQHEQAVSQMLAAGDLARAGETIWRRLAPRCQDGEGERLEALLERVPGELLGEHPALALSAAHRDLAAARLTRAERLAMAAAEVLPAQPRTDLAAGVALIEAAVAAGGIGRMDERSREAERLTGGTGPWMPLALLLRGVHARLSGDAGAARNLLEEALHRSPGTMPQTETLALAQLALIETERGDWERAHDRVVQAGARIEEHDLESDPACALAIAVSAWVACGEGEIDEAKRLVPRASRLLARLEDYMPWHMVETRVVLARACIRLGEAPRARQLLSQASRTARGVQDCALFRLWLDEAWGLIDELSAVALSGSGSLTMAELRILRFLPTHLSFREIGERLHVSTNTVKSQAHAIYGKLGTSSRSEAVARAAQLGLINASVV